VNDPERLLARLPEESPPPEIVLAAVRVFRYRAIIAVVVVASLGAVTAAVLPRFLGPVTTSDAVAAVEHAGGSETLGLERDVAGAHVLLWDLVSTDRPTTHGFVHVQAWDDQGRNLQVGVRRLAFGGVPAQLVSGGGSVGGGGDGRPSTFEVWAEFRSGRIAAPIEADVQVLVGSAAETINFVQAGG
jgi:hypothetical protein